MSKECRKKEAAVNSTAPCCPPKPACCAGSAGDGAETDGPLAYFERMTGRCLEYAEAAKEAGRPVVGIMCEYTPRELILAAGGIAVCLCGGSAEMIPSAEEHLPANLCPLIKSTYGYHKEAANPFLEMADLLVAETTCDGKKKMFELMGESRDLYVLELPQMADSPEGLDWWTAQLRKLRDELTRRFGVEITDAKLREAIRAMNRERRLRRDLAAIMKKDRPPLTGRDVLDCKSTISGIPADLDQYARVIETLGEAEGDRNVADRVRVLMTGVPVVHGAERVLDLIEDCGGLVVCQESCTGLRPILDDVDADAPDPLRALAEKYYRLPCSVMTPNLARLESIENLSREYRAQCVIELIWQACLTYDVESHYVRRLAEESLHVPYLRIETDYSPSDSARIAVRIEALFEMVRGGPAGVEGRATG